MSHFTSVCVCVCFWSLLLKNKTKFVFFIQNALCSCQVLGWSLFLSLFTLISPPFSHPFRLSGILFSWGWWKVIIQVRWKKSNSLFSRLPVFSPMLVLQCPFFVFSLSFPLSFWLFCSFVSISCMFFFLGLPSYLTDAQFLSCLFFFFILHRSWCSGRDSQRSTVCSDRWRSGTSGFHRHLCPHHHHLVLCPAER